MSQKIVLYTKRARNRALVCEDEDILNYDDLDDPDAFV